MSKSFEAYLELDKTGLENKYVIIVNGKIVVAPHLSVAIESIACWSVFN